MWSGAARDNLLTYDFGGLCTLMVRKDPAVTLVGYKLYDPSTEKIVFVLVTLRISRIILSARWQVAVAVRIVELVRRYRSNAWLEIKQQTVCAIAIQVVAMQLFASEKPQALVQLHGSYIRLFSFQSDFVRILDNHQVDCFADQCLCQTFPSM